MRIILFRRKRGTMPFMGNRMRDLRKSKHLTQVDLAKALKIKQRRISEYETGKAEPIATTLAEIVTALECSADFLLGITNTTEINDLSSDERDFVHALRRSTDPEATRIAILHSLINNISGE